MAKYSVSLLVEMEADSPGEAVVLVADMADGWSYEAKDIATGSLTWVHMVNGEPEIEKVVR